jgi:hypothetical protein
LILWTYGYGALQEWRPIFVSKPLAIFLRVIIVLWTDSFCTDPIDTYHSKLERLFWTFKASFYGQIWLQMVKKGLKRPKKANNLAPFNICKWKKHIFKSMIANKYYFVLVGGLNLYIYLKLDSSENFQNELMCPNRYNGKNGPLHHQQFKKSQFWGFSRFFGHLFYIQVFPVV